MRRHPPDCICWDCEPVSVGFFRVWRWVFAAFFGFIFSGLALIILLFILAGLLG
jgi:hypothetical protein